MNTFTKHMQDTYNTQELKEIAQHGCASYAPGGMIYYYETAALYDLHCEALHEILNQYKDATGEWPVYVTDSLNDATQFKNAMVWFCAEWVAYELTENDGE